MSAFSFPRKSCGFGNRQTVSSFSSEYMLIIVENWSTLNSANRQHCLVVLGLPGVQSEQLWTARQTKRLRSLRFAGQFSGGLLRWVAVPRPWQDLKRAKPGLYTLWPRGDRECGTAKAITMAALRVNVQFGRDAGML